MARIIKSSKELTALPAYTLEYEENLTDINSCGLVFRHNKSGARVCVVSNDDNNKVFSVSFRTPPPNDTGVPHIIEHTVLCGSKKYPLKDPFIELAKGSLNTFLNAMTFPDKTMYPVASCNDQDFKNLMNVYMDAVFYPNIYYHEEIFKQEGWHYELESADAPLKLNGIVYSEMKGAFSSPESQLYRGIQHSLFPDTAYGTESGGDPDAIPELTYEQFLDFHRRYYHPINSYIFLYGDMDVEERLNWIDADYLSQFDEQPVDSTIQMQDGANVPKECVKEYSIGSDEDEKDNTYLAYNTVVGNAFDLEECMALPILSAVLIDKPGAPVKQAILDAGIGKDVFCYWENECLQPFFAIVSKNANPEQKDEFVKVIRETLEKLVKEGLSKKSLLAAINNREFQYREGDYGGSPKGLLYDIMIHGSWLYDDKAAFNYMHANDIFKKFKDKIDEGYFEKLIQKYFLDSEHMTVLTLKPKKGLNNEKEEKLDKQLQEYKAGLSKEEIDALVEQTKALKAYQDAPSTKEALESIPLLTREDIKKEVEPLFIDVRKEDDVEIIFHEVPTNGIAYLKFLFDEQGMPAEYLPYLGLVSAVFAYVNTENYSYSELADESNIYTGGIWGDSSSYQRKDDTKYYRPVFTIGTKFLYENAEKAAELIGEILLCSKLSDTKRLQEILAELRSRLQMRMNSNGHSVAVQRCKSYFSQEGVFSEAISGISFYRFVDDLCKNFDAKKDEVIEKISWIFKELFTGGNLTVSLTAEGDAYEGIAAAIKKFTAKLPKTGALGLHCEQVIYPYNPKNEGFRYAGQVQYAGLAANLLAEGGKKHSSMQVLRTILAYDYLWNNVRVKGGAYGCMSNIYGLNGDANFVSYRDPNLRETYEVYEKAAEYIANFEADEREMTKYIIGTMSGVDTPQTPRQKGDRSLFCYLGDLTIEDLQEDRDKLLATDVQDIRNNADAIRTIVNAGYRCTLGSEAKLEECKDLFDEVKPLLEN